MSEESDAKRATERRVPVHVPESGFPVVLFFNRFGIEQLGVHLLIHFGLESSTVDSIWRPPISRISRVDITNAVRLANYGPDAELRCYHIPVLSD